MTYNYGDKIQEHRFSFKASVLFRTCVMTEVGMFLRYITQQKDEVTVSVNISVPVSSSFMLPVAVVP